MILETCMELKIICRVLKLCKTMYHFKLILEEFHLHRKCSRNNLKSSRLKCQLHKTRDFNTHLNSLNLFKGLQIKTKTEGNQFKLKMFKSLKFSRPSFSSKFLCSSNIKFLSPSKFSNFSSNSPSSTTSNHPNPTITCHSTSSTFTHSTPSSSTSLRHQLTKDSISNLIFRKRHLE